MLFQNKIKQQIEKLIKQNALSKIDILNWLEYNNESYKIAKKPINCQRRTLPCMCFERNEICLFIDIYSKLNDVAKKFELNTFLKTKLLKFEKNSKNKNDIKNWLSENLTIGLSDLWFFMSPNNPNIKLSFINGKLNDEFEYLRININGEEFKSVYDFANLFSKLFIEEKILPNEYAKWKYENEITD